MARDVIGRVMFPVLSQMQDDDARTQNFYLKASVTVAMVTFPMMCGLWVLAEPFVLFVLGPKWQPVALLLMILAPVGAIQSLGTLNGLIYLVKGRTDLQFRWGLFFSCVVVLAFVIGLRWGIVGVATTYAAATAILIYPGWRLGYGLIDMPVQRMVMALARPAAAALLMLAALESLKALLPATWSDLSLLATAIPTDVFIYCALIYRLETDGVKELISIVRAKQMDQP